MEMLLWQGRLEKTEVSHYTHLTNLLPHTFTPSYAPAYCMYYTPDEVGDPGP